MAPRGCTKGADVLYYSMERGYRPGWAFYHGSTCSAHPELMGRRNLVDRHCPACPPPGPRAPRKLSPKARAKQQGIKTYCGRVCPKHPEAQGERRGRHGICVACYPARLAQKQTKRRERYARDTAFRQTTLGYNYKSRAKQKSDPTFRLQYNIRCRLAIALRVEPKRGSTLALLGVPSVAFYKAYLEEQFLPGMTWANYGTVWHVDHIIPVSLFDLQCPVNQHIAFCYENTRPLWAKDNISRGNRIAPSDVDILL